MMTFISAILSFIEAIINFILALFNVRAILLKFRNRSRKKPPSFGRIRNKIGRDPTPLHLCEYLGGLISQNYNLVQDPDLCKYLENFIEEIESGILRVYFFGHQSAGKSTLINTLVGQELSPTFPSKMTTCLVRIRSSINTRTFAVFKNGRKEDIGHRLEQKMNDWSTASIENRPDEVIIETSKDILGLSKVELVDSPGTGSAWLEENPYSLENEIVDATIKFAAIVIIIYRYERADLQAHERLIRALRKHETPTISICNLDPNWADYVSRSEENKNNAKKIIDLAEERIRQNPRVERCFRIMIEGSSHNIRIAQKEGSDTVLQLKKFISEKLADKDKYLNRQSVLGGIDITEKLLEKVTQSVSGYQSVYEAVVEKENALTETIYRIRKAIEDKPSNSDNGVLSGSLLGAVTGLAAGATIAMATGGLLAPFMLAGAASGLAGGGFWGNHHERRIKQEYLIKISSLWENLKILANRMRVEGKDLLSKEINRTIRSYTSYLQPDSDIILKEILSDFDRNKLKVKGYSNYIQGIETIENLTDILELFKYMKTIN